MTSELSEMASGSQGSLYHRGWLLKLTNTKMEQ